MKRLIYAMVAVALMVGAYSCGESSDEPFINNGGQEEPTPEPEPTPDPDPTPTPDPEPTPTPDPDEPQVAPAFHSTGFMKGSTMCFAQYMVDLGLVYREGGVVTDPYVSMKNHGSNIVRLQLNIEDFPVYNGATIDWASWNRVVADAKKADANGMDIMLTLKPDADDYTTSGANHNLAPAVWESIKNDEQALGDALYEWVYTTLYNLAKEGIYPRVVAVGNEVNINFIGPSASSNDASRTGRLLARGFAAVRAYSEKYNPDMLSLLHIADPAKVSSYVSRIKAAGGDDFDVIGVSWYPGYGHSIAYTSMEAMVAASEQNYGYPMMILETAYGFTNGNLNGVWKGDWCNNAYNDPAWSDNEADYSPANQRAWLRSLAEQVKNGGGLGVITWGTESLPDTLTGKEQGHGMGLYTYPADWAYGSTWENNSYWDFTHDNNLHEGIDWMMDIAE